MLASLLRWTLGAQWLLGAALGWWLHASHRASLAGALAVAVLMPLLISGLAFIVTWLRSRAAGPLGPWLRSLPAEMAAGIDFFMLRQPWARAPAGVQMPSAPRAQRLGVVLVHGYICNHRIWDALVPRLRAQGHAVVALDLEPVFASIDDYAEHLHQAITALQQSTGWAQVVLVGHSMGGLACRAYLRRFGAAAVARVITLGTPHAGTQLARGVRTPNGRQMQWQSPWLAALAASETEATRALFRIGLSPQDNIVYPQRAQTLAGVAPTVFEGLGHLQLCKNERVLQWVLHTTLEAEGKRA